MENKWIFYCVLFCFEQNMYNMRQGHFVWLKSRSTHVFRNMEAICKGSQWGKKQTVRDSRVVKLSRTYSSIVTGILSVRYSALQNVLRGWISGCYPTINTKQQQQKIKNKKRWEILNMSLLYCGDSIMGICILNMSKLIILHTLSVICFFES